MDKRTFKNTQFTVNSHAIIEGDKRKIICVDCVKMTVTVPAFGLSNGWAFYEEISYSKIQQIIDTSQKPSLNPPILYEDFWAYEGGKYDMCSYRLFTRIGSKKCEKCKHSKVHDNFNGCDRYCMCSYLYDKENKIKYKEIDMRRSDLIPRPISFIVVLISIVLAVLKLTGLFQISWFWVLSPFPMSFLLIGITFGMIGVSILLTKEDK